MSYEILDNTVVAAEAVPSLGVTMCAHQSAELRHNWRWDHLFAESKQDWIQVERWRESLKRDFIPQSEKAVNAGPKGYQVKSSLALTLHSVMS